MKISRHNWLNLKIFDGISTRIGNVMLLFLVILTHMGCVSIPAKQLGQYKLALVINPVFLNDKVYTIAGLAIGHNDNIYILDEYKNRIVIYDAAGNYMDKWDNPDKLQFWGLNSIYINSTGNVFASDSFKGAVLQFDQLGKVVKKWTINLPLYFRSRPQKICSDAESNFYVIDDFNNIVLKFDRECKFLFKFGSFGKKSGQFDHPTDIVVDSIGKIYVLDSGNDRIQKFNPDGNFIMEIDDENFDNPMVIAMAIDIQDNFYLLTPKCVLKYDPNWRLLARIGENASSEYHPINQNCIAVDQAGNVYVNDLEKDNVLKYIPVE